MLILTFHAIDELEDVISYSPADFRRLIALLHEHRFESARLGDHGERKLVITFDDAYQSVYDFAFPILAEYGMQATVFVTGLDSLEGRTTMQWDAIRDLDAAGWEIGGHTSTHPDLTAIDLDAAQREIADNKAAIEHQLGKRIRTFAYPFGRYNRAVRDIAAAHYEIAVSDRLAMLQAGDDPFALPRLEMYYFRGDAMRWLVSRHLKWVVRGRSIPRDLRRKVTRR